MQSIRKKQFLKFLIDAETADESDDEAGGDGYYPAKASKKKEKKRQEREAQRQVWILSIF